MSKRFVSKQFPTGLYKGVDAFDDKTIVFIYNNNDKTYGWHQYGDSMLWSDEGRWKTAEGWFVPAIVKWASLIPSNELEFLVLTGKEFKKPDGT